MSSRDIPYRISVFIFFLIGFLTTNSQTLVNCAGNTLKDNSYYFEYSVGEICITTLAGSTNNVTQGLLQPNIKKIPPACDIFDEKVLSFENPTFNLVRIVGRYDWITDYKVYSADGKLVKAGRFTNNVIDLTKFPAAMYFIQLFPGCNDNYKILKVIKRL